MGSQFGEGRPSVPSSFLERPDFFFGHPQPLKNPLTWRLLALFPQISMGCCCWLNGPRIATPILPHLGVPWCVFVVGSRIAVNRKVQEQRLGATMNPRSWEKTPVTFGLCIHCTTITLDTSGFHLKLLWNHDTLEQQLEIFSCNVYWYLIFATPQSFIVSYHWVNVVWFIIKGLPRWYTVHEPLVIGIFKTRILSILYGSKFHSPWFYAWVCTCKWFFSAGMKIKMTVKCSPILFPRRAMDQTLEHPYPRIRAIVNSNLDNLGSHLLNGAGIFATFAKFVGQM